MFMDHSHNEGNYTIIEIKDDNLHMTLTALPDLTRPQGDEFYPIHSVNGTGVGDVLKPHADLRQGWGR